MRMPLAGCSSLSVLVGVLLLNSGNAQLFFDPATYSFGGRGALTHALEVRRSAQHHRQSELQLIDMCVLMEVHNLRALNFWVPHRVL